MTARPMRMIVTAVSVVAMTTVMTAQERDRAKIADRFKWNLADIYPTEAAWRAQKEKITAELPSLRQFQGRLGSSAQTLADALDLMYRLDKELSRLYVYASMSADEDTRVSSKHGMQQEMQQIYASFSAQASFVEPEILKTGGGTIDRFVAAEPRLKNYSFYLHDIV